ncbi:hypothetical protein JOH50_004713 [Rhizobium leguminosarum]|nr:hypothetical protein [Rhizobium leguminosarum]
MPHQHVRVAGMIRRQGDADAAGDMLPGAVEIEGTAQRLEQPLRKTPGPLRLVELQYDGEFVAAEAGDEIALLRQLQQPLRYLAKQRVAGGMSLAVVDFGILQLDRRRVKSGLTY